MLFKPIITSQPPPFTLIFLVSSDTLFPWANHVLQTRSHCHLQIAMQRLDVHSSLLFKISQITKPISLSGFFLFFFFLLLSLSLSRPTKQTKVDYRKLDPLSLKAQTPLSCCYFHYF